MNKKTSQDRYWNKQDKEKKPVLLVVIASLVCLALAYIIGGLSH